MYVKHYKFELIFWNKSDNKRERKVFSHVCRKSTSTRLILLLFAQPFSFSLYTKCIEKTNFQLRSYCFRLSIAPHDSIAILLFAGLS